MKKQLLGSLVLLVGLGTTMSSAAEEATELQVTETGPAVTQVSINLTCTSQGGEFPALKFTNTTGVTIPKGWKIYWKTSTTSGSYTLTSDLAPNATATLWNTSGTCTAKIYVGKPDLTVSNAKWIDATTATVQVKNSNPFAAAGSSVVRFESYKCAGNHAALAGTKDSSSVTIGKGETKTVQVKLEKGAFLVVTADFTKLVSESNETNNQQATGGSGNCIS